MVIVDIGSTNGSSTIRVRTLYVYARICVMYEHVYKNADTDKNAETQRALNAKDQGSTGRSKGHAPMRMHDLSKNDM